jgi:hypothetical protein
MPWEENHMLAVIGREIGWKSENGQGAWRFDCKIHALVNHLNYSLYGFSEKEELLSKMINEGTLTREAALRRLERSHETQLREREISSKTYGEYWG